MKQKIVLWLKIIRPGTLMAFLSPVCVGLWLAAKRVNLDWGVAIDTLVTAACIQILSNLVNDYYDYRKGADTTDRLGPERAISTGQVSPRAILRAVQLFVVLSLVGGLSLVVRGGLPILIIGSTSLLFAYLYSATRHSLSHLGIADLFVLVYFGPVAAAGTAYLQCGSILWDSVVLGLGCGAISTAVLTVNNIRDYEQDRRVNKRTIIVRWGLPFGRWYYFSLLCAAPLLLALHASPTGIGLMCVASAILFALFGRSRGRQYNQILVLTGVLNMVYALLVLCFV